MISILHVITTKLLSDTSVRNLAIFLFLFTAHVAAQDQIKISKIQFFGTTGMAVEKIKADLPIHEGQVISSDSLSSVSEQIRGSIKNSTGTAATDVAPGCCDEEGNWMIYIGLQGKNFRESNYNPPPTSAVKLPTSVVNIYHEFLDLILESIHKQATEDNSRGYALSSYPPLRAKQLAMHDYAIQHSNLVLEVLLNSSAAEQREVAAQLVGYLKYSQQQISALVHASRDDNDGVRNNAVRSLAVIAMARPGVPSGIPASNFVAMLNSGIWKDRNKGLFLLGTLTASRNPTLLTQLRRDASDSIVEMAKWRNAGHADPARMLLGRIAGIDEVQLQRLVAAHDVQMILSMFEKSNGPSTQFNDK